MTDPESKLDSPPDDLKADESKRPVPLLLRLAEKKQESSDHPHDLSKWDAPPPLAFGEDVSNNRALQEWTLRHLLPLVAHDPEGFLSALVADQKKAEAIGALRPPLRQRIPERIQTKSRRSKLGPRLSQPSSTQDS